MTKKGTYKGRRRQGKVSSKMQMLWRTLRIVFWAGVVSVVGGIILLVSTYLFWPDIFYAIYNQANRVYHRVVSSSYRPYKGERFDGIDVSHHNGIIDWEIVAKNQNIKFVYIKATEGYRHLDKRYSYNVRHARKAGLRVGSYHLLTTRTSMQTQFGYFSQIVDQYEHDLIPMLDIEEEKLRQWSPEQKRDSIAKFIRLTREHYGVEPVLYCSHKFYKNFLAPDFDKYILFLARYSNKHPKLEGQKHHDIWQFTEHGRVRGIEGDVDLDRFGPNTDINDILY